MNFPPPSQSPQQFPQNNQPPQPILQRNHQSQPQPSTEIQRTQPPIPMINPNIQYSRYPQQLIHPQPKINQKPPNNRRKNQKTPYPQPFPVNPQPSIDFSQPQLQMILLKAQELSPEHRELFIELVKEIIPSKQQQYFQYINDLLIKFTDDKVYRYFREPRVPHVFKAITAIKPIYYLTNFQNQREFKPQPKDRIQDVIYIASYIAFPSDPIFLKMLNLQVNNTNIPPQTFGEPDESIFYIFGTGDKIPSSLILSMAKTAYNSLCWLVIQAVRVKSPMEFINEYYSKVKLPTPTPQELHAKCPFCQNIYDAFLMIKEIQRKGDSICPSCRKRIPINKFIFDSQTLNDDSLEKRKMKIRPYEMIQEILMKEMIKLDDQVANSIFNFDPNQSSERFKENENNFDDLNEYVQLYETDMKIFN